MRICTAFSLPALILLILLQLGSPAHADIAVIVHPQNPLTNLTEADLKKIFLGRLPLFPQTGQEIHPLDLPEEHATFAAFYRQVLQLDGTKLKRYRAYYLFSGRGRLPATADSAAEMVQRVADDTAAIGYVDTSEATGSAKVVLILRTAHPRAPDIPAP